MNSKERGLCPFNGKAFDRLPMWYGGDPKTTKQIVEYLGSKNEEEALYSILGIDYKTFVPKYTGTPLKIYDNGVRDTIWGVKRGGYYGGQALNHPLADAETIAEIESYNFPELDDWEVKFSQEEISQCKDFCIIGGSWSPFFHDVTELTGMEKFFIDMLTNPELVEAIIDKCFNFYFNLSKKCFEENKGMIDVFFFGNDFGSQRALLMSPEMWRKFFKPKIAQMVQLAHKHGIAAFLHSCGDIHEIIPDLIEIGVDALNPIQVSAANMDPKTLKKEYGRDIVFFGGIDENEILSRGTEKQVREETKKIIDILGYDGRYILAASHDYLLPEVPAANIVAMYDEAKKYR